MSHSKPFTSFTGKGEISRRSIFCKRPEKDFDICYEQICSMHRGTYHIVLLRNMQGDECLEMMIVMVHTSNFIYKNRTCVFLSSFIKYTKNVRIIFFRQHEEIFNAKTSAYLDI